MKAIKVKCVKCERKVYAAIIVEGGHVCLSCAYILQPLIEIEK